MTRILLISYGYARQIINNRKNGTAFLAILMAMRIRRYSAAHIAQWGRSRATLDARCHDWNLPSGDYSPRITPADAMVINLAKKSSRGLVKSLFVASVQKA